MAYKKIKISALDNAVYVDEDRDILIFVTGHGTGTPSEPDEDGNTDGTATTRSLDIYNLGMVRGFSSVGGGYSIVSGIQGQNAHFKGITGTSGIHISGTDASTDTQEYSLFGSGMSRIINLGGGLEIAKNISNGTLNCRTLYGTGDISTSLSRNNDMVIVESRSPETEIIYAKTTTLPFTREKIYKFSATNINPVIGLETGVYNKNGTSAIVITTPNTQSVTLESLGSNAKRKVIYKQLGSNDYVYGVPNYIFLKYISGSQNLCATDTPAEVSPNIFYSLYAPRLTNQGAGPPGSSSVGGAIVEEPGETQSTAEPPAIKKPVTIADASIVKRPNWAIPAEQVYQTNIPAAVPKRIVWTVKCPPSYAFRGSNPVTDLGIFYNFPSTRIWLAPPHLPQSPPAYNNATRKTYIIKALMDEKSLQGANSTTIEKKYGRDIYSFWFNVVTFGSATGRIYGWGTAWEWENTPIKPGKAGGGSQWWITNFLRLASDRAKWGIARANSGSWISFYNNAKDTAASTNTFRYIKVTIGGKDCIAKLLPDNPAYGASKNWSFHNSNNQSYIVGNQPFEYAENYFKIMDHIFKDGHHEIWVADDPADF